MKLRFVPVLILCLPFVILGSQPGAAGGCGWDYPCAPEPGFGRPHYRSGRVTIHNNYGNVNIYTSRRSTPPLPEDSGFIPDTCQGDGCRRYGCGGYPCTDRCGSACWIRRLRQGYCGHGCQSYVENSRIEAEERAEWREDNGIRRPPPPRDEWMYEKRTECAPPYCPADDDSPPPASYYYRRTPDRDYDGPRSPRRFEPAKPDLTPRERFEGPRYPPK
jgi:hypothetical protein